MSMHKKASLSESDLLALESSLYFLHVPELKEICSQLGISATGLKGKMVENILSFITSGTTTKEKIIPASSCAPKLSVRKLAPDELMLFGSYKCDTETRAYFKKYIGNHFHFTAFGHDWVKEQWAQGNPPIYAEFATFWEQEFRARKIKKAAPKKEWALITFVQKFCEAYPEASREEVIAAWKQMR